MHDKRIDVKTKVIREVYVLQTYLERESGARGNCKKLAGYGSSKDARMKNLRNDIMGIKILK